MREMLLAARIPSAFLPEKKRNATGNLWQWLLPSFCRLPPRTGPETGMLNRPWQGRGQVILLPNSLSRPQREQSVLTGPVSCPLAILRGAVPLLKKMLAHRG